MECFLVMFVGVMAVIAWVIEQTQKTSGKTPSNSNYRSTRNYSSNILNEKFPNGYSKKDYHDYGISDEDIEFWGLDQPGAPSPFTSGMVVDEIIDDGDFFF